MLWRDVAMMTKLVYGTMVDWDEEFFICPECGEPIYKEDYPELAVDAAGECHCPVCEELY